MQLIMEIEATPNDESSDQLAKFRRTNEDLLDQVIRRAQYFADHPEESDDDEEADEEEDREESGKDGEEKSWSWRLCSENSKSERNDIATEL